MELKILKENDYHPRILKSTKLSNMYRCNINIVLDMQDVKIKISFPSLIRFLEDILEPIMHRTQEISDLSQAVVKLVAELQVESIHSQLEEKDEGLL
jgi:hypothetical protein